MTDERKHEPVGDSWKQNCEKTESGSVINGYFIYNLELKARALEATIRALEAERDEARKWAQNADDGKNQEKTAYVRLHDLWEATEARVKTAEARVAQLEAALEPFAKLFCLALKEPEDIIPNDGIVFKSMAGRSVTYGDFRRARALLSDGGAK